MVGRAAALLVQYLARPTWFRWGAPDVPAGSVLMNALNPPLKSPAARSVVGFIVPDVVRSNAAVGSDRYWLDANLFPRADCWRGAFAPVQDDRIFIEKINGPCLFDDKGTPAKPRVAVFALIYPLGNHK